MQWPFLFFRSAFPIASLGVLKAFYERPIDRNGLKDAIERSKNVLRTSRGRLKRLWTIGNIFENAVGTVLLDNKNNNVYVHDLNSRHKRQYDWSPWPYRGKKREIFKFKNVTPQIKVYFRSFYICLFDGHVRLSFSLGICFSCALRGV